MSEFKDQAPEPKRAPPAERPAQKNPSLLDRIELVSDAPYRRVHNLVSYLSTTHHCDGGLLSAGRAPRRMY